MADQVLAIGYKPEEFETESQKWIEYGIELVFAVSAQQAQYLPVRSFESVGLSAIYRCHA